MARSLAHRARLLDKRVIALGGAKNHLVAAPDCNVEMCSQDIVASFSGCAGQRCMAASVLLVIGCGQSALIDAIVKKASLVRPGSGAGEMGPVIDCASRDKIRGYIAQAAAGGAKILLDGRGWGGDEAGWWVGPTIILHTCKDDAAMCDEIFGPVLSIFVVQDKEEVWRLLCFDTPRKCRRSRSRMAIRTGMRRASIRRTAGSRTGSPSDFPLECAA